MSIKYIYFLFFYIYIYFFYEESREMFNKQESNYYFLVTFLLEIVNVFIMKLGIWFDGKENDILIISILIRYNSNYG